MCAVLALAEARTEVVIVRGSHKHRAGQTVQWRHPDTQRGRGMAAKLFQCSIYFTVKNGTKDKTLFID